MADPHKRDTFQALVDAIIPVTPMLAAMLGTEQAAGAVNVDLYEYVIQELDHSYAIQDGSIGVDFSFSKATARLLDRSAIELIRKGLVKLG